MTDDLEGKLDLDAMLRDATPPVEQIYDVTDELPAEPKLDLTKATITMIYQGSAVPVTGVLSTFSFGNGWLCSIEGIDEMKALDMAQMLATYRNMVEVFLVIKDYRWQLTGNLDFTIAPIALNGCSLSVSADFGTYL